MSRERLAILGGPPVRDKKKPLPYSRPLLTWRDRRAVQEVLRRPMLTSGPEIDKFEQALAPWMGPDCVATAMSSGTAALHGALSALRIGPRHKVIVPALTFAATANCVVYPGATPLFADVDPKTLLIDPAAIAEHIDEADSADGEIIGVIPVDYAGQLADYSLIHRIVSGFGWSRYIIADACHSLGAAPMPAEVDIACYSFHPVKAVTTGEGGAAVARLSNWIALLRRFRNHGITVDPGTRMQEGLHGYDIYSVGYNYRMSGIQAALGFSQLQALAPYVKRRKVIAGVYDEAFAKLDPVTPIVSNQFPNAYHLYVVRVPAKARDLIFAALRAEGIMVNVHYPPVHLFSFYQEAFGTREGMCPVAEQAAREILSLPIHPAMNDDDVQDVIEAVTKVVGYYLC